MDQNGFERRLLERQFLRRLTEIIKRHSVYYNYIACEVVFRVNVSFIF